MVIFSSSSSGQDVLVILCRGFRHRGIIVHRSRSMQPQPPPGEAPRPPPGGAPQQPPGEAPRPPPGGAPQQPPEEAPGPPMGGGGGAAPPHHPPSTLGAVPRSRHLHQFG